MNTVFMYERKGQETTLGKQTLTGRREELLYLYDANNKPLGRLQEGDVLTITDRDGRIGNFALMYKASVTRLGKEGFIYAELLDGLNGAEAYNVNFDANGGYCPVSWLKATYQAGYAYPTLKQLPVPSRSGYFFAGWETAKGNPVDAGHEFTDSVKLRAKWIKYTAGGEVKPGLTISRGEGRPFSEQTKPYGCAAPSSGEKIELCVCEEVKVIGETGEMYQCLRNDHSVVWVEKRFIATQFEKVVSPYDYYLDIGDGSGTPSFYYDEADGEVSMTTYQGNTSAVFYVIGKRGNWLKAAIPRSVSRSGEDTGAGVAWIYDDWRDSTYCRVTFCPGEGICWLDGAEVEQGQSMATGGLSFPAPCLSGYEFEGWYTDPVLGKWFDANTKVTESLTVYAHYKHLYDDYQATTEKAPIYDRTSTSKGTVLGYVDAGEVVIVQYESKQGKFAWVTHDGVRGWVQTRYLISGNVRRVVADRKIDRAIRSRAEYHKGTVYRDMTTVELFLVIGTEGSYEKVAYPCKDGYAYIAQDQFRQDHRR